MPAIFSARTIDKRYENCDIFCLSNNLKSNLGDAMDELWENMDLDAVVYGLVTVLLIAIMGALFWRIQKVKSVILKIFLDLVWAFMCGAMSTAWEEGSFESFLQGGFDSILALLATIYIVFTSPSLMVRFIIGFLALLPFSLAVVFLLSAAGLIHREAKQSYNENEQDQEEEKYGLTIAESQIP